jgi:predicted GNAT family N-acyltransferase
MPETIQFRRATQDDSQQISDLVSTVTRKHIGPLLSSAGLVALLRSMDLASTRKRISEAWPTFCALQDQVFVGVIVIKPPSHLYQLFVRSDTHGKGVGRSLFQIAEMHVIEDLGSGIKTVNASLNAVSVYQRLGFELKGEVKEQDDVRFQPMVRTLGT